MAAGSLLLPNGDYLPAQTFSQDGHTVKGQEVVLCDSSGTVIGVLAAPVRTDPTGTTAQPVTDNAGSLTVDNAGTFAVQDSQVVADNAGFTDGTTKVFPGGYIFDESAGTALTENDAAAARIDSKRAQVAVIEDETTRGRRAAVTAANALKVDGSGATQPVSGTVTASGPLTDTQLRASAVSVEQATSVTVDAGTGPFPVSDNAGSLTVDSPGLPAALDGVSLKVKEQSPLTQGLTDAQLAARLPLSVEQATSVDVLAGQQAATTGTITTSSSTVGPVACTGYQSVLVSIQGTYAGVGFAVQIDPGDGNFYSIRSTRRSTGLASTTQTPGTNVSALFVASIAGASNVQVKASAYTSGTANVRIVPVATPVTDDVVAHLYDSLGLGLQTWSVNGNLSVTLTDEAGTTTLGATNTAPLIVRQKTVATSTVTNVAASATNVTLLSSNAARLGCYIQNDGTSTCYVKLGTTATATTSYSAKLAPGAFWEMPGTPLYTGRIDAIWQATGGNGALITELS